MWSSYLNPVLQWALDLPWETWYTACMECLLFRRPLVQAERTSTEKSAFPTTFVTSMYQRKKSDGGESREEGVHFQPAPKTAGLGLWGCSRCTAAHPFPPPPTRDTLCHCIVPRPELSAFCVHCAAAAAAAFDDAPRRENAPSNKFEAPSFGNFFKPLPEGLEMFCCKARKGKLRWGWMNAPG